MSAATARAPRVALVARRGRFLVAEPFFGPGPRLALAGERSVDSGDLVLVDLRHARNGRGSRATVTRRLGRPNVARDVIEAMMLDRGLRRGFDPAVEHEARHGQGTVETAGRRDLRSLPTFTIDPVSARDFDDAISATRERAGWRVWVHIADVSSFVAPRSTVDHEAYRRATSVYVPGAVEPMLPGALSNHACSLIPGQDRLAVTVEMVIEGGRVTRSGFHRSVIRSVERLDYDRVDRVFAGCERPIEPWGEPLAAARAAASELRARRSAQPSIAIDSAEPEFEFDRDGHVVAGRPIEQTESHQVIEHLMIAANEQVAGQLESRRLPALYRVHERPDGEAAERLLEQLASLGVPTPAAPKGHLTPQQAADLVGQASQLVARWRRSADRGHLAFSRLILRSVKQAYYDPRNLGHAGLRSPRYCHFTSPIRRYPDLICQRALLSTITGEVPAPEASFVAAAGPWTSAREREAMMIEHDGEDIARCFLLERELAGAEREPCFAGEVVGLVGSGAFVAFGEAPMFEGRLAVRRMRGDWWELNEMGTALIGAHTGRALRLGDPVDVRVSGIDPPRGRVDLELAVGED